MSLSVTCPECDQRATVPDEAAGKRVKCKGCGAAFRVPAAEPDEPPAKSERRRRPDPEPDDREEARRPRRTRSRDEDADEPDDRESRRPRRSRDTYDEDDREDRRRRSHRDDEDDEPRVRSKPKKVNVLGIISLIKGIGSLLVAFIPCFAGIAMIPAGLALFLGIIGLVMAKKSKGRMGSGLPVAGICVSVAALLVSGTWLVIIFALHTPSDSPTTPGDGPAVTAGDKGPAKGNGAAAKGKAGGYDHAEHVRRTTQANAVRMSDVALAQEFSDNAAGAEEKYKNKVVEVTGRVTKVVREKDAVSLYLDSAGKFTVHVSFGKEEMGKVEHVAEGQVVVVRGYSPDSVLAKYVTLGGCVFVRSSPSNDEGWNTAPGAFDIEIKVVAAFYGQNTSWLDVTDKVQARTKGKHKWGATVRTEDFGEPAPGFNDPRTLLVRYQFGKAVRFAAAYQNTKIILGGPEQANPDAADPVPAPAAGGEIEILGAFYGKNINWLDVTDKVREMVKGKAMWSGPAKTEDLGEPAPGFDGTRSLVVRYKVRGEVRFATVDQNETITIK